MKNEYLAKDDSIFLRISFSTSFSSSITSPSSSSSSSFSFSFFSLVLVNLSIHSVIFLRFFDFNPYLQKFCNHAVQKKERKKIIDELLWPNFFPLLLYFLFFLLFELVNFWMTKKKLLLILIFLIKLYFFFQLFIKCGFMSFFFQCFSTMH